MLHPPILGPEGSLAGPKVFAVHGTKIPPVVLSDEPFIVTEDNLDEVPG